MIRLDPKTTALVLIDLQNGIAGSMSLAPQSGETLIETSKQLATRFRSAGAPVVLVNVGWTADGGDRLTQPVDAEMPRPAGGLPADWAELVPGLAKDGDLRITKRQWSAFYGTELDLQLRRRGVRTIVLGGVATNFGVESTARLGWEHGYSLVLPKDLSAAPSAELHEFAFNAVFPRIGRVTTVAELIFEPVR
ncbi:hydrolase [Rhizobium halophytocola]|uniref:Nicotinamidase-related amidase n=1 Tax=Rhizobium halophytocola TaxID=735519 RepID=A0ABS4DYQ7_9HYPH|nr:hydrolase [Rhizobium halophytocola]MBP1850829.1 nicotinamidase-related amidase [Rhizobium halophytocola]